jgi:hypothetical protein
LIGDGRAKERIANAIENPTGVLYDTGRAVFDLDLLAAVARTQEARSVTTRPTGSVAQPHVFPLSFLLYCAACDHEATEQGNPKLRARITGHNKNGLLRYRHADGRRCRSTRKSILAETVETDFARLIEVMEVHPDSVELMAELAVQMQLGQVEDESQREEQKRMAIAKHRRALKNNLIVFQTGDIEAEEYFRQKDYHERQIAYWEAQTSDRQRITLELTTTLEMIGRLKQFWAISGGEDRRMLAHSLFDEIVYDLDAQRIVDFKLKRWAEPFLVLRAALYLDEMGEEMKNRFNSGVSSDGQFHDPNGTRHHTITTGRDRRVAARHQRHEGGLSEVRLAA